MLRRILELYLAGAYAVISPRSDMGTYQQVFFSSMTVLGSTAVTANLVAGTREFCHSLGLCLLNPTCDTESILPPADTSTAPISTCVLACTTYLLVMQSPAFCQHNEPLQTVGQHSRLGPRLLGRNSRYMRHGSRPVLLHVQNWSIGAAAKWL